MGVGRLSYQPEIRYEMVWNETTRFVNEMVVDDKWPRITGESKIFPCAQNFCERLTLCVILSCAFGFPLSWSHKINIGDDDFRLEDGIKFQGENATLMGLVPSWLLYFPIKRYETVVYSQGKCFPDA